MKFTFYCLFLILIFSCNSIDKSNPSGTEDNTIDSTATDSTAVTYTQSDSSITPNSISVDNFKKSLEGKSMEEVKALYGNPCKAQEVNGLKIWYYGENVCGEDRSIKIINEDTGDEVGMVQITFNYDNSVNTINIY